MTPSFTISSSVALPSALFSTPPRFQLGDRVSWKPLPHQDFGTILGVQAAPTFYQHRWGWQYLIHLDSASPSYPWAHTDWAWEDDLTLLVLPDPIAPCQEHHP